MADEKRQPRPSDLLAKAFFGREVSNKLDQCVRCGTDKVKPEDFKDEVSKREFKITTYCQKCQDYVFSAQEE